MNFIILKIGFKSTKTIEQFILTSLLIATNLVYPHLVRRLDCKGHLSCMTWLSFHLYPINYHSTLSYLLYNNHFFRLSFHMYAMTIFSVFRLIFFLLIVFLCEFPSLVFVLSFLVSRLGQLFSLPLDLTRVATIGSEWVWESWL